MPDDRQQRFDRLLKKIDEAHDQHDWSAIFELAQQVLKIDPGNTESLGYLKAAQRRLKASSAPAAFESLGAFETTDLASSRKADREDEEPAGESLAGGVFVGRGKEMGQLKAAIEEALSGGGQLVELDWVKKSQERG